MQRKSKNTTGAPALFYIQNRGFCGNSLRWWREGGCGYTSDIRKAWKVPNDKAQSIQGMRRRQDGQAEDIAWPVALVDSLIEHHVTDLSALMAGYNAVCGCGRLPSHGGRCHYRRRQMAAKWKAKLALLPAEARS